MKKIKIISSQFLLVFLMSSCNTENSRRNYQTKIDFANSTDSSWVSSIDAIPDDASEITVRSEAELGLSLLSYKTKKNDHIVNFLGMRRLKKSTIGDVINNSIFNIGKVNEIHYACNRRVVSLGGKKEQVYEEIIFAGDADKLQYYWNSSSKDLFEKICQGGASHKLA